MSQSDKKPFRTRWVAISLIALGLTIYSSTRSIGSIQNKSPLSLIGFFSGAFIMSLLIVIFFDWVLGKATGRGKQK